VHIANKTKMEKIYMDNAATTPVDKEVAKAMQPYFSEKFGNASSLHLWGREAKMALDIARAKIAKFIGAKEEEIIFTSGGTESNNLTIKGLAFSSPRGSHIITSKIEHHAITEPCEWLEKQGYKVTYLDVDQYGMVNPKDVEKAITEKTILVSIMHANNEIGTIEPIAEIGKICKKHNILFHTDAVQSFGKVPINVKKMNIDLLSTSAHKIYGPKGVGFLYIRKGIKLTPVAHGGGHEQGIRSGTENVAGIVGFAKAVELAKKRMLFDNLHLKKLQKKLIEGISKIENAKLNGHPTQRLANNVHFSFSGIEGESLVVLLDIAGIGASTGSACTTKSLKPSHVLTACGLSAEIAHSSLRLTLGRENTPEQINYVLKKIPEVVANLRKISPLK